MGSSPKLKTIPTNNMRAFIILALIACASASCITRQSTTYYTPSVSQSSSSSDSSSYSTPYNSYGGYGGYGYGGYGGYGYGYSAPVYSYVEESSSDSISYSITENTSENSSSSESSDSSETYTYEESYDYVDDDYYYVCQAGTSHVKVTKLLQYKTTPFLPFFLY